MTDQTSLPESQEEAPYIPSSTSLPELTWRSVGLGIFLSVLLSGANIYLGLFAGMTVSASIPAAVMSMAILRWFRNSNILENNIVQTAASAGESLAAGVIFTMPALVILGHWKTFPYWEVTLIAGLGGLLGVLFTIPLRRALIVEQPLRFPEGVATAEVLKVGEKSGADIWPLFWSALVGALFKLGETGLMLWGAVFKKAAYVGGSIAYFGTHLSPALVGVGFIVGLNIAILVVVGGALNWLVAIPILAKIQGVSEGLPAVKAAGKLWSEQTRYLGVGAMVVGGLWALIQLRSTLWTGIQSGVQAYRTLRQKGSEAVDRLDRDTPMQWTGIALLLAIVPLFFLFQSITKSSGIAAFMAVVMLIAGFLFSAVASYMAGLVGSSNNPISGVTIATILLSSLLLLLLLGSQSAIGPAAAILIGSVVCCAAAIGGDNMQDLKAGRLVGATPYKQQVMQAVGVISAAFVMAPILTLLQKAYGIGVPTPEHTKPLAAPQATLMESVARGVFQGGLPWTMIWIGMGLAVVVILIDVWLKSRESTFRMPVLAVAVGVYLPFYLTVPIFIGGLLAWAAFRKRPKSSEGQSTGEHNGLLFSAGLITGEAVMGILLAIPIAFSGPKVLALWGKHESSLPGMALLALVCFLLYRYATQHKGNEA